MSVIIAQRNGKKRSFNRTTWELLGPGKEGWIPMADQIIDSAPIMPKVEKPKTGQRDQTLHNTTPAPAKIQKIDESKSNEGEKIVDNGQGPVSSSDENLSDKKLEFEKHAAGLTRGAIKDFLDTREPAVEYDKVASKPELIATLGEHLKFDVVEFQKLFS